jgi:ABC-type sugar transport system ATPase subunit
MNLDVAVKSPAAIIVAGPSGCGKTRLVESILVNNAQTFTEPFSEINYIYPEHSGDQSMFDRLKTKLDDKISFHEGFPLEKFHSQTLFNQPSNKHVALVIDDLMTCISTSTKQNNTVFEIVEKYFSVLCHHQNTTVIITIQNLQAITAGQRSVLGTLLRSCTHLVLFAERRNYPVVKSIASSFYPGEKFRLIEPFKDILKRAQQYTYLVIDFRNTDVKAQVREGGLRESDPCWVFLFSSDETI